MTRLQSEWHRLYLPQPLPAGEAVDEMPGLVDAKGQVRAMVLSLGRPADWAALSIIWKSVQTELELPAPAIAVSGTDSYQLWFSLAKAVPAVQAHAFLASLRKRYLPHIAPSRFRWQPEMEVEPATAGAPPPSLPGDRLPGTEVLPGQWSAFVAPDLAPMFAETPWLDIPPSAQGQAELLAPLQSIGVAAWQTALARLQEMDAPKKSASVSQSIEAAGREQDPKSFLTEVMNDGTVDLALRIEAAKALMRYSHGRD